MYRKTVYTPSRFSCDTQTVVGGLDTHVWDVILTQNVERLRDALQPPMYRNPALEAKAQRYQELAEPDRDYILKDIPTTSERERTTST